MVSSVQRNKSSFLQPMPAFAVRHDRLLAGVAEATRRLLAVADFDTAVNEALAALAGATESDRVSILQNHLDARTQREYASCPYEWVAQDVVKGAEVPGRYPMVYAEIEGYEDWLMALKAGRCVQMTKGEMSASGQATQEMDGALSLLTVPIFVKGAYWGNFGFDDCTTERVWAAAEVAVLETAAASFAGALERRESLAALERRDALLNSVNAAAQCLVAGEDLGASIAQALRILGEGTRQDRVYVFENVYPQGPDEVFWEVPYEWNAKGILPASVVEERWPLPMKAFPADIVNPFLKGEAVQCFTRELSGKALEANQIGATKSLVAVPISVAGMWWGLLGFDDCTTERVWSEAEVAVLETAAACIGSAIEREISRQEREQAAQARAAELEESNRVLSLRDRWLEATAAAAEKLLSENDLKSVVVPALQIIGEGIGVDRMGIMNAVEKDGQDFFAFFAEWDATDQITQGEHDELLMIPFGEIGEQHLNALLNGDWYGGDIEDFAEPFRSGQKSIGVKSTYSVPIFIDGRFWGIVGIDHCREKRILVEAEIAVFQTMAACFGSAIERDQSRQAREATERTALIERERATRAAELEAANAVLMIRDRWLETTAAAANELLSSSDVDASVQAALRTIGENLECDRLCVMRWISDPKGHPLGAMQIIHEWDAANILQMIEDPDLSIIPATGFEDWFTRLLAGEWVGSNVSELSEPARSGQEAMGVLSTYAIPIFIDAQFWGVVAMDYCRQERRLSAAELSVFKTAASCVGSAIYQAEARRNKAAQERARLLGSVAEAANLLLRSVDYAAVLPEVVRLLGEGVGCDRAGVLREIPLNDSDDTGYAIVAEWCSVGTQVTAAYTPELTEALPCELIPDIHKLFLANKVANFLVADTQEPARSLFSAQGNTSMACVPIIVDGKLWGVTSFDNCGEPRLYDEAEIAILKVAADSIAAAISRQAQDEALRASEKRYRTLFEVSAEGIYRMEMDEPISRDLPVLEQVKLCQQRLYVADANNAFAAMYGHQEPESFIGCRLADFHAEASEQNIDFISEFVRNPDCRISNSESEEVDVNGNVHYFLNNVIGIVENNHLVRAWGTQTDITELKRAQKAQEAAEKAILAEREKAAQERATELAKTNEAISHTLNDLAANPDPDRFLGRLLLALANHTGACKTHMFLYYADTNTLLQHSAVQDGQIYQGAAPSDPDMLSKPIPADLTAGWQKILASPQPLTYEDLGDPAEDPNEDFWWPESIPWHRQEGHREIACARMKAGDIPIGFIGFTFRDRANHSPEQLEFIQALTNQATLCVHLTNLANQAKTAALGTALTSERNRLAREIHDTLAQAFTGISLQLEAAKDAAHETLHPPEPMPTAPTAINLDDTLYHVGRAGNLARRGLSEARRSVRALRSAALETDTLPNALKTAIAEITQTSDTQAYFTLTGTPYALPEDIQTNLLRIGQEATTNTLRHAQANILTLTLHFDPDQVSLTITDDGQGCAITSLSHVEGFGLVGMRERVHRFDGYFSFTSAPGEGTVIVVAIPMNR